MNKGATEARRELAMTRVLIVDDNDCVRMSLVLLLNTYDGIDVVGEADNGETALELGEKLQPDIILSDLMMPDMDGATVARLARDCCPHAQVIILTSSIDDALIAEALRLGVAGYVSKAAKTQQLLETIYSVSNNQNPVAQV
jgi:two-component system, NarL family, response regulator LiaR